MREQTSLNAVPTVAIRRSKFLMWANHRSTMNAGELIPVLTYPDIYPGDSFRVRFNIVLNQTTPLYPTMDNSWLDIRAFFVRNALVWDHWNEFIGENKTGSWAQQTEYTIPQIKYNAQLEWSRNYAGSLIHHMGVPIGKATTEGEESSALPYRGYCMIWNEFYRDQNVCPPIPYTTGDNTILMCYAPGINQPKYIKSWFEYIDNIGTHVSETGINCCAPVFKFRDYFNSCLPAPQKGPAVDLPLGEIAPIEFESGETANYAQDNQPALYDVRNKNKVGGVVNLAAVNGLLQNTVEAFTPGSVPLTFSGYANLQDATSATINAVRMAGAMQRILEKRARGGTRAVEINLQQWGVRSPDFYMQRPEYLGGKRIPITMNRVLQTSSTDSTSPQGHQAAFSVTVDSDELFDKTFLDYGTLFILLAIRTESSYSQGLPRMFSRKYFEDFYNPSFANLGEQAVLNQEIYKQGTSEDTEVFGYQERWAELRSMLNLNTGLMATDAPTPLSAWHYGEFYESQPILSKEWRRQSDTFVYRTLAVQNEPQYYFDSRCEITAVRPLPLWSIPGYFDHF